MNNKIALYLPTLNGGGAEHFMVRLANGLAESGYSVDLVVVNAVGPNLQRVSKRVNVVNLRCTRVLTSFPKLVSYLRKTKPLAIISTQNHASIIAILAHFFARSKSKLYIRQATILNRTEKSKKGFDFFKTLLLILAKRTDLVITTTEKMKREFLEESSLPTNQVIVIPNPISIDLVTKQSKEDVDHPWFFSDSRIPVVIAVGRLEAVKGFDKLIESFALLRQKVPVRLVILGEGVLRSHLECIVKNLNVEGDVLMPGFVDNIYPYLSRAEVFVLTSHYEGFPNGMLEAMACGTNVAAFNCPGGVSEILEEGKWGALIPPGDTQSLAEALHYTLSTSNNPDVICRAKDFSMESVLDKYLNILIPNEKREL